MSSEPHKPRQLDQLQRWLQQVITHPLGVEAGIASDEARAEIEIEPASLEGVITRSKSLTSADRLAVYANAYYARLLDCMRELFPALVDALGEETFDEFAFGYLQAYPSQSYTLNKLADRFVDYLQETRPDLIDGDPEGEVAIGWPDFLIDLARLEWAIDDVFDGPGVEKEKLLSAVDLAAVPPERWPEARLTPACCLRLLAFRYPVNDYYTAFRHDADPPLPEPKETYVAITRRDYVVWRFPLSRLQYELLTSLMAGETVGAAISQIAEPIDDDEFDGLSASLRHWFETWSAEQFFQRVEI